MEPDGALLTAEEQIIFSLRALYREYGYTLYKMGKFEEYDLYADNKDFLISKNVITFTDAGGKLLALKPDVTLSIVRSCRDRAGEVQKLCYNENVYRAAEGGHFRELTQSGVECIGALGETELRETVELALRSLERAAQGGDFRLNLSHLGVVSGLLDRLGLEGANRAAALRFVERKNAHELSALCAARGVDGGPLARLARLSGPPAAVLPELSALGCDGEAVAALERAAAGLGEKLNLDFSIVSNLNYYNGLVFKGYVAGVPEAVLSGGQYDQLLRKLGRFSRAIGFAVYVDRLERLTGGEGRA